MAPASNEQLSSDIWGRIVTPRSWIRYTEGLWCGDNDIFNGAFEPNAFFDWLIDMRPYRANCVFIVAPDAVCDPAETIRLFYIYEPMIRALGYPVAFVCQDGQEYLPWPPPKMFDAVFIGGSTEWKMGPGADQCIRLGKKWRKWIHIGRVNSQIRIRHFQLAGANSVDGTGLCYAPKREVNRLGKQLYMRPLFSII